MILKTFPTILTLGATLMTAQADTSAITPYFSTSVDYFSNLDGSIFHCRNTAQLDF